jgi:hypothetical protein
MRNYQRTAKQYQATLSQTEKKLYAFSNGGAMARCAERGLFQLRVSFNEPKDSRTKRGKNRVTKPHSHEWHYIAPKPVAGAYSSDRIQHEARYLCPKCGTQTPRLPGA